MKKAKLSNLPTYVYIDASNITNALLRSNIRLEYPKLFAYLNNKYTKLKTIKYFEGIDKEDEQKKELFRTYGNSNHVEVKSLERKAYTSKPKYRNFLCSECNSKNAVQIFKAKRVLKSNVDVFIATELFSDIATEIKTSQAHIIILSCDGDFAEPIKKVLQLYSNISISVFATPYTKNNRYLSSRLKNLKRLDRYNLVNILNIKDRIQ